MKSPLEHVPVDPPLAGTAFEQQFGTRLQLLARMHQGFPMLIVHAANQ